MSQQRIIFTVENATISRDASQTELMVEGNLLILSSEAGVLPGWSIVHSGYFLDQEVPRNDGGEMGHFDFGYALTCHKSQGSQWERVGVVDESRVFRDMSDRWLYTAVTRAAKEVRLYK